MKKKLFALGAAALMLTGCGKIPKLSNGDDAVITFENGHMISANELYESVKNDFALAALINLMDTYILETEFADYKEDAEAYAQNYIESYKQQLGSEEELINYIQQYYGYSTIEAFQDYIYITRMQNHAIEEYAKKQITDEQKEDYYNNEVKGDVEISHILVTPDVKDGATDDEKKEAEDKAKETIKNIIAELEKADNVEDKFKELVKKYSEDENTKDKDGSLGRITYGDLSSDYDELLDHAYRLKDGGFSTDVITTELGYHVILKTKSYEKESYDKLKDEVTDDLKEQYITDHINDIYVVALQDYRKNYGMEIQDDEIKRQYTNYMTNLLNSANNTNTEDESTE